MLRSLRHVGLSLPVRIFLSSMAFGMLPVALTGLAIVAQRPDVLAPGDSYRLVLGAFGLNVLLASFASVMAARHLTRPLDQITSAARAFGAGKIEVALPRAKSSELAALTDAFEEMRTAITLALTRERSEKLFSRTVLESVPSALLLIDPDLRVLSANHAAAQLFQTADTELHGRRITDWFADPLLLEQARIALAGGPSPGGQLQELTLGTRTMLLRVVMTPLEGPTAWTATGALVTIEDLTELTEVRQRYTELLTLHAIAAQILTTDRLTDTLDVILRHTLELFTARIGCVFLLDPETTELALAAKQVGAARADSPGCALIARQIAEHVRASCQECATVIPIDAEQHDDLRSGDVAVAMATPIIATGQLLGVVVLGMPGSCPIQPHELQLLGTIGGLAGLAAQKMRLYDQLRHANRELSQVNAALVQAARLKDEFLANMSHELRTPLNTILGRAGVLHAGIHGLLSEDQQRMLRSIVESGQHLRTLIDDILDLAKLEAGKLELHYASVQVAPLCQAALRILTPAAHTKQISLSIQLDPAVSSLRVDAQRLTQILVKLLANAVKFTPAQGQLGLEVVRDAAQGHLTFTVWDTGIGIAQADLERLFQPFVQGDGSLTRQYGGTGLGLSLVARMTALHGGSVGVESTVGVGSRFWVRLPWEADPAGATGAEAPAPWGDSGPLVLLAEGHPEQGARLAAYLEQQGCQVLLAQSGPEALALAETAQPTIAVIDVQLPVLDGLTVLQRLRARAGTKLVLVAVTGLALPEGRRRAHTAGADLYLTRPIRPRALIDAMAQGRSAHQEETA
ncbi:MAG: response regulator [Chloroflexales bacterium]|nr:response regulator [Chloroflexales bacterium]